MKDIAKIIKLDLISVRPYYTLKNLLILLGLGIFYASITKSVFFSYGVASMFIMLFSSYPFMVGEESGIDTLYATFGIKKEDVVLGRYIWGLILTLIGLVVGFILAFITTILIKEDFNLLENLLSILANFISLSIIISIQYPLYFKYGYKKAKTIISSMFISVMIIIFALSHFKDKLQGFVDFIIHNPYLSLGIVLLIWIFMYFVSIKISTNIYKKRDLV